MSRTPRTARRIATAATAIIGLAAAAQPALAAGSSHVYTESNAASGNAVIAFTAAADGTLTATGSYPTGGLGSGSGLGSQGAIVRAGRYLLAVDAGSNDVAVLRIGARGLSVVSRTASGGVSPVSIDVRHGLVEVLNAGGAANVTGFRLHRNGTLTAIRGGTQPLSIGAAGGAQVAIAPDSSQLIVTEKGSNTIDTFRLHESGRIDAAVSHASNGLTPFGFAFGRGGSLIVSEAFGGAPGASALSSYSVLDGGFGLLTGSAPTHQTAACWVVTTRDGRYAYTTDAGADAISGYAVDEAGHLSLLDPSGVTASVGAGTHPTDAVLASGDRFLYTLDAFSHQVSAFTVADSGALTPLGDAGSLPASTVGLAS
jgi:6-phosphogluconolactonase (cycloisomerase 2 family)